MTKKEWLKKAKKNQDALLQLIDAYHPRSCSARVDLPITALGAEIACEHVRERIQREESDRPAPVEELKTALAKGNIPRIEHLLNSAWFGVPESRGCWRVPGFSEAVDLLDDPPEDAECELDITEGASE